MNIRKNVLRAATAAIMTAGLALASPAQAQEADLLVTATGPAGGKVGLGNTAGTRVKVANKGAVAAEGVTVTLDVSAWPADQKITAISGCTPAALAAGDTRTNANWFPCTITGTILPDVAADDTVDPPVAAVDNAKTVTVTVRYGVAKTYDDVYDASGARIEAAWVCPAVDLYGAVAASAATTTAESVLDNNAASAAAPQAIWADVEVTMTGPASISHGGGTYTFDFTVKNLGPCTVNTDVAVDDNVTTAFVFQSATGMCADITDDFTADFSDYQYCDGSGLAPNATLTGTKVYKLNGLASDLISSNQGTGLQITGGDGMYTDPNGDNDVSDVTYVVTKSMGCSTTGGGTSFLLLAVGLGFLFLKRRK